MNAATPFSRRSAAHASPRAPCAEASASGGAAPVILLHGFAQTPRSWDAVANALRARGHEVHVPDLYVQVRPFSLDAACRRVAEIVRDVARASGEPCAVAGYSMGGRIALETLARAQAAGERLPLSALALEGAGLGPADEAAREAFRARGDAWAADLRENGVAAFMDRWETLPLFASQRALSADVRARVRSDRGARGDAWAADLRENGVAAFMDRWETLPLFASQRALSADVRARVRSDRVAHDAEELASSLTEAGQHCQAGEADSLAALACAAECGVRVVYAHGSLDEKYGAVARRVAELVPAARIEGIARAGHNVHLEQPEAFARVVAGLLQ